MEGYSCLWLRPCNDSKLRAIVIETPYRRDLANQKDSVCYLTSQSPHASSRAVEFCEWRKEFVLGP